MQTIIVHRPGCQDIRDEADSFHVFANDLDILAADIYSLLEEHDLPFYCVEPHSPECPGRHFPWEDLEFRIFTLSH